MPATPDRPIVRIVLTAAVVPLALTAAAAAVLWSWRDELPDPVARHWGSGGADGFSSLTTIVAMTVGLGVLFTLLVVGLAVVARDRRTTRTAVGTGAGVTAFVAATVTASTASQRGLADAADAEFSAWWVLLALAVGVIVGVGCAALVPWWSVPDDPDGRAGALALGADERAAWSRPVVSGGFMLAVSVGAVAVMGIVTVLVRQWWALPLGAVLVAFAGSMHSARVTVDRRGVTVRSRLGWPRFHTALAGIARADVVHVNALRDFGGFGIRISVMGPHRGTRGLVLRSGEALRLTRVDGSRELVVVDDAETAAGLVNGLLQRAG